MNLIELAERSVFPDWLVRRGIRQLLTRRMREESTSDPQAARSAASRFLKAMRESPLAVHTDSANVQHYEVPAEFFRLVLGPRLKYSCCWYEHPGAELAEAEADMLKLTCQRADLSDGQDVLELGCGWGSLTLWMAEQYPGSRITAVSNSHGQREFIEAECRTRQLENVTVITADMRDFSTEQRFDRVVSVEMFEHMRNYQLLLQRIAGWLRPDGKLFIHIFCHRDTAYLFETEGAANWMGRHFFTGGMMPSDDLLLYFQDDLVLREHWRVLGTHYAHTCDAWLGRLDANRARLREVLSGACGESQADVALQRWRIFFMACAELFRYRGGREWFVSHYLFQNRQIRSAADRPSACMAATD